MFNYNIAILLYTIVNKRQSMSSYLTNYDARFHGQLWYISLFKRSQSTVRLHKNLKPFDLVLCNE